MKQLVPSGKSSGALVLTLGALVLSACSGGQPQRSHVAVAAPLEPTREARQRPAPRSTSRGVGLEARCQAIRERDRAAGAPDADCDWAYRVCVDMLAMFQPRILEAGLKCVEESLPSCSACSIKSCSEVLTQVPTETVPECESMQREADEDTLFVRDCNAYATALTQEGRRRFVECWQKDHSRSPDRCFWDTDSSPCALHPG